MVSLILYEVTVARRDDAATTRNVGLAILRHMTFSGLSDNKAENHLSNAFTRPFTHDV